MRHRKAPTTTEEVSRRMKAVRQKGTGIEIDLRKQLFAEGYRYRVNHAPLAGIRAKPDIVFTRQKLAVFIDGCFWHVCPLHATWTKNSARWWREKLEGNMERDRRVNAAFEAEGWTVLRIWEHEKLANAARQVMAILARLR